MIVEDDAKEVGRPVVQCVEKEIYFNVWALGDDVADDVVTNIKEHLVPSVYKKEEIKIKEGISRRCSIKLQELQNRHVKVSIGESREFFCTCSICI